MSAYPLVGREADSAVLERALDATARGAGSCVVLEGPPGIGKSRMLAVAQQRAGRLGLAVAPARATELDRIAPLTVLLTALRACQPPVLDDTNRADLSRPEESRFWLVDRLGELIESYSRTRPLLIALDDLQWADELTALALRILVPLSRSTPVCWLLARRPSSIRTPTQQAVDWLIAEGADRLALGPLSPPATAELCAQVLGAPPGPSVQALAVASGGNPFLVEELLDALRAAGRVQITDGAAVTVAGELPTGFVAAVDRRLHDLTADARRLLEAASILGRPFTLHEVAGVLGRGAIELLTATKELCDSGTLVEDGTDLSFRHDLIREAVYNGLSGAARQALHRETAAVLRTEGRAAGEIAEHLLLGARRGDPEAIAVLDRAVREVAPTAPGAAADLVLRMLDLLDRDDPHRLRLVADAVRLLASAGRLVEARQLGEECLCRTPAGPQEAAILLGLAEALKHAGQDRSAIEYSRRALAHPDVSARARAQLLAIQAHALLLVDDLVEADRIGTAAMAAGRTAGEHSAVVFGMVARTVAAQARGELALALDLATEAVRLTDTAGGEPRHRHPRLWLGRVLVAVDRFESAEAVYAHDKREAEELGTAWSRPLWHHFSTDLLLAGGRLDDAEAEAEAGLRVAEQLGAQALTPPLLASLGYIAVCRDELGAALDYLRRAQHQVHGGTGVIAEELVWELAAYYAAAGRPDEAVQAAAALYDALPQRVLLLAQEPFATPQLVRFALAADDRARAERVVTAAAQLAARNPETASLVGAARHADGLYRADLATLREAVATLRAVGRPLCLASAIEDTGLAEHAAGGRTPAVALLEEAMALYLDCGAKRDALRVRRRLRAAGVRRSGAPGRRRARTGWESLTESELRVARLVAEAHTTREIADQLFLSRHTVDSHIRHAFAKLGISSRVELTRQVLAHDREGPA